MSLSSTRKVQLEAAEREALAVARDPVLAHMLREEHVETSQVDSRLLVRLLATLRHHPWLATIALLLATFEALLMTLPPWLIGLAVDAMLPGQAVPGGAGARIVQAAQGFGDWLPAALLPGRVLIFFCALVLGLWMLRWLVAVSTTYIVQLLGQRVVHRLRVDVFGHLLRMDATYHANNPVGRLVNRTTFDVQALSELFSDAVAQGTRDLLFVAVLVLVMLRLDVPLALVLIAAFPLLITAALIYRRMARPSLRTHSAVQSRMNAWLAENIGGMRENHLYGKATRRKAEFDALTQAHQGSVRRVIMAWGFVRPAMMMTSGLATAAILWFGYHRVLAGVISIGLLLTFLQYTGRIWVPVRNLAEKFNLIQTALTSGERVMDVLDARSTMVDASEADRALQIRSGEVHFDHVKFVYPGTERPVLHDLSIHLPAGRSLALVGDTGAGKSTIVSLLCRMYDVSAGAVRVDGHAVREYTLDALRKGIALVPQDVVIFATSLRDNITLGRSIPDERVLACLEAVHAMHLVERSPLGLDQVMDEGGRTLSIGERQLVSFARALVDEPPILVLDEATASVDSATEARIQRALQNLTRGRTSVLIAHRLSTIRDADEIVVLRHGRILERGDHASLLAMNGAYAELYRKHRQAEALAEELAADSAGA